MARYQHLVFVCSNRRPRDNPKGSCAPKGAQEVLGLLKQAVHSLGFKRNIRVVESGCLNCCNRGVTLVVQSAERELGETWYTGVNSTNAMELFESHFIHQRVYEPLEEDF